MSAYPLEHIPTREKILMRLAEQVRVRRDAARSVSDTIRRETGTRDIRGTLKELLLSMNDGRSEAFDEVLKLIEQELKKTREAEVTEMLNEAGDKYGF